MVTEEEVVEKVGLVEAEAVGGGKTLEVGLGGCRSDVVVPGRRREGVGEVTGA